MPDPVTTRFETEGDAAYKKSLDEITAKLKVNYSAMGLLSEQYDSAGQSEDALRAKSDALRAAMENQRAKVDLLSAKVKSSTEATGASSAATLGYQTSLNKAQTELARMQNQLDGYDGALKKSNKSMLPRGSAGPQPGLMTTTSF